ncbi:MAG: D-lyxose/D-mannose family sugar isomerase [Oscillospiraceae bacterium]|nr:D-lyxose/D-mannose family sugar isomerase [Oscillospiraceae bacterium]
MKRSHINSAIAWAKDLFKTHCITLPPFAYWNHKQWEENADKCKDEIFPAMLGWDVTDYGQDRFSELGAVLFTVRNGVSDKPSVGSPYAEKYIILSPGQYLPCHCHKVKTEDIINRAGGIMRIMLWNSLPQGGLDPESDVVFSCDGMMRTVKAGEPFDLTPGSSLRMAPGVYHIFGAAEEGGALICGEVSSINDDVTDNYFTEQYPRFTEIEEDEAPLHPLCNEYAKLF